LVSILRVGGKRFLTFFSGYTQALRPGVKATFGLALDTQKLNEISPSGPAHKVGASFVFES
jgi:voltage-dependent anion channel protein 2